MTAPRKPARPRPAREAWRLLGQAAEGFLARDGFSRGAAIAYYTIFAIAPILVMVIAGAGLIFGEDAVQGAIAGQLQELLGRPAAEAVQAMLRGVSDRTSGVLATALGAVTLLLAATAVFAELKGALNAIWQVPPRADFRGALGDFLHGRLLGLGLVALTGFLLLASVVANTALVAVATWANPFLPAAERLLWLADSAISLGLIAVLFAAIYKVLPDRPLTWGDVAVGALLTALLFSAGQHVISWWLGSSGLASAYGAASAAIVMLLWVYYSAQIFLFGAEFTRAWVLRRDR